MEMVTLEGLAVTKMGDVVGGGTTDDDTIWVVESIEWEINDNPM